SQEGRGSTFQFKLNLPVSKAQGEDLDYTYPDFNDITILVVDDNETNRFILKKTLTAWGIEVIEAQSGPQALAVLKESKSLFDLIILDQQMPGMDGFELAQKIREEPQWSEIKMIMLSSAGNINPELKKKLSIAKYITKPAKQSKLFDILMSVLRHENGAAKKNVKVVTCEEANTRTVRSRILLVEDNPDNQRLATKILLKAGYIVDLAENGQLAVEAADKFQYDIILMDIQMPVRDGFTATKEIRAFEERKYRDRVPIIALTAHAMSGYKERCLMHDMDDYITKPIKKESFFKTINKWLDPRPVILVVDDSVDNRNLIKNYLKKVEYYRLVFAHNGQEAVDIFKGRTLSLILMDMEMPVMNGYEATSAIRNLENGKDIPILALTAHQGRSEINRCLQAGCTDYISKPMRKQTFLDEMQRYLGNHPITDVKNSSLQTTKVASKTP
ncbi:MAG: response regulator, partial [bacterium]